MTRPRTAVVVGATNGIGKAISCRLAHEGYRVIAVGRDGEGRRDEVLSFLEKCTAESRGAPHGDASPPKNPADVVPPMEHEFRPCDAFDLSQVKNCASDIARDHGGKDGNGGGGIDALVMTQGMATMQSYTPTIDGNDQKLTLHYWSRAAFASCLLPAMRRSSTPCPVMPGGPVVLSVLSGGVHSPYVKYRSDPELRDHYSVVNAANFAGYYTDLFLDKLASFPNNSGVNFVHAAPGFVRTNWGTEMPSYLRGPIRMMQRLGGKSPKKCAEYMVGPILKCGTGADIGLALPSGGGRGADANADGRRKGVYILNEDGTSGKLTKGHTPEAMEDVWRTTKDVLGRSGIALED